MHRSRRFPPSPPDPKLLTGRNQPQPLAAAGAQHRAHSTAPWVSGPCWTSSDVRNTLTSQRGFPAPLSVACVCKRGKVNAFSHDSGAPRNGSASSSPGPRPPAAPLPSDQPHAHRPACTVRGPRWTWQLLGHFCAVSSSGPAQLLRRTCREEAEDTDGQGAAAGRKANLRFAFGLDSCSPLLQIPGLGPQNFQNLEAPSFHSTSR